jgi:hypothetical protein
VVVVSDQFRDLHQNARLEALERRVSAVMERLGMEDPVPAAPPGISPRVAQLARSGRTVEAVKAQMQETGADMRTARDAVAAII